MKKRRRRRKRREQGEGVSGVATESQEKRIREAKLNKSGKEVLGPQKGARESQKDGGGVRERGKVR